MFRRFRIAVVGATLMVGLPASGRAQAVRLDGPLSISPPSDITVTATDPCGATYCANVSYSFTATGGVPPYRFVCNLDSGSQFTVGSHTVTCTAYDSVGNSTPQASFTVTVTGGGPPPPPPPPPAPLSISPPSNITTAATAACGSTYCANVSYSFTATGGVPPYRFVCNLDSGSQFTVGSHTVTCLAQDSVGNSTPQASSTVTVTASTSGAGGSSGGTGTSSAGSTSGGGSSSGGGGSSSSSSTSGGGSGNSGGSGGSPSAPTHFSIALPQTVTVPRGGTSIQLTIKSNDPHAGQRLCWHPRRSSHQTCASGTGTWHVKIKATSGKEAFVLKRNGKVVAHKTVTIKIKA